MSTYKIFSVISKKIEIEFFGTGVNIIDIKQKKVTGLVRNRGEHHKLLRLFQRYVDQLVLLVSGLANSMRSICLLFRVNHNG